MIMDSDGEEDGIMRIQQRKISLLLIVMLLLTLVGGQAAFAAENIALAVPQISEPSVNATVTTADVVIKWNAVNGATDGYVINVREENAASGLVNYANGNADGEYTAEPSYTVPGSKLQPGHKYYVWIAARVAGQAGYGSQTDGTFAFTYDYQSTVAGDLTGDRLVDDDDLALVAGAYGTSGASKDLNKDGIVDLYDLTTVSQNYSNGIIGTMPDEYKQYINQLRVAHPNWIFEFYDAGTNLDNFVQKEYDLNNPTPKASKTAMPEFVETDQSIINARQPYGIVDGGFYLSTISGVEFFANPLHFLNDGTVGYGTSDGLYYDDYGIYQFLQLGFDPTYQTADNVKKMLADTYFATNIDNYAKWFFDASKQYSVSPYMLASKAIVEGGASNTAAPSSLLKGYNYNGTTVYNFFGIQCTDGANATLNGAKYAYDQGWTTPELAIAGGAKYIANGYINAGQDTYYTMRYDLPDLVKSGSIAHQYASSISDAWTKGQALAKNLMSVLDNQVLKFKIAVFGN